MKFMTGLMALYVLTLAFGHDHPMVLWKEYFSVRMNILLPSFDHKFPHMYGYILQAANPYMGYSQNMTERCCEIRHELESFR